MIQAGDLLVSYNAPVSERATKDFTYNANNIPDMHIGIVVGVPSFKGTYGQDLNGSMHASNFWNSVKVVSVRPGLRNVTLGTWGNAENSLGGFTLNPKQYQIRRLLKWKEKVTQPNGTIIDRVAQANGVPRTYELVDARPKNLEVAITFKESFDRFIPNTGEPLLLTNAVKIKAKNKGHVEVRLSGNNRIVVPSIPQDAYFNLTKNPTTYGNIYNNTGGGVEYIVEDTDDKWKVVALFTNNVFDAASSNLKNRYKQNLILNANVGGNFIIDDTGTVIYSKDGTPGGDSRPWGIRPQTPSGTVPIRPGDDFFIGFELKNQSDVQGWNETQRLAIYDKKMLWRANLYINEGAGIDWNDVHKWNAPTSLTNEVVGRKVIDAEHPNGQWIEEAPPSWWSRSWGYNEWNRVYSDRNAEVSHVADYTTIGNGGQNVTPHSFIWYINNTVVQSKIGYDRQGHDSPFEFNHKTYNQKKLLSSMYFESRERFLRPKTEWGQLGSRQTLTTLVQPNNWFTTNYPILPVENENSWATRISGLILQRSVYNNSLAPGNLFLNYLRGAVGYNVKAGGANINQMSNAVGNGLSIGGVAYHPYIPGGLSNKLENWDDVELAGYAAGIDCVGFVYRSISYTGSAYQLVNGERSAKFLHDDTNGAVYWGGSRTALRYPYLADGKSIKVAAADFQDENDIFINLEKVSPGDIMYYDQPVGQGHHTAIIQNLTDSNGDGQLQLTEIHLIEATIGTGGGIQVGNVYNLRTLNSYSVNNWAIVRMKE